MSLTMQKKVVHAVVSDLSYEKIREMSYRLNVSRSEILRRGLNRVIDDFDKRRVEDGEK